MHRLTPLKIFVSGIGFIAIGLAFYITVHSQVPGLAQTAATVQTTSWKTYEIQGTKYQIEYPASFSATTSEDSYGTIATFEGKDKTLSVTVSNIATGFESEWQSCSPPERVQMGSTTASISYLCSKSSGGNYYRFLSSFSGNVGLYIVAVVSEQDFSDPQIRDIFRTMVSSLTEAMWKTYANTQYGFQFNYPPASVITETKNGLTIASSLGDIDEISLLISPIQDGITSIECPLGIHEINCETLTNANGVEYTRAINTGQLQNDKRQQLTAAFRDSRATMQFSTLLTDASGTALSSSAKTLSTFDEILGSAATTTPDDWVSYINTTYSYTLQHPKDVQPGALLEEERLPAEQSMAIELGNTATTVTVEKSSLTLESYVAQARTALNDPNPNFPNKKVSDPAPTTFAGQSSLLLMVTGYTDGQGDTAYNIMYLKHGGYVYAIRFTPQQTLSEEMAQTFALTSE